MYSLYVALSETVSAIISFAPAMASSAFATSFSSLIYSEAFSVTFRFLSCSNIASAKGSRPFSLAIVALVRFFGLYGRYKSSNATIVLAASILAFNSSVNLP